MFNVEWLELAQDALDELDQRDCKAIMEKLERVRLFPNSHPAHLTKPFRGSRQFVVRNRWLVVHSVKGDTIWVRTIYGARSKPL